MKLLSRILERQGWQRKPVKARIKIELVIDINDQIRFDFEGNRAEVSALLLTAATNHRGFQMAMRDAYNAFMKMVHEKQQQDDFIKQCELFINHTKN